MPASTKVKVVKSGATLRIFTLPDRDIDFDEKADKTNVLERNNTDVYTPTGDYHPSTKKYTDDGFADKSDKLFTINAQTGTTYTLQLTDSDSLVTMSNAIANTLTIPTNASVAFLVGTKINIIQRGVGITTIEGDTGVFLNDVSAGTAVCSGQYEGITIYKEATDSWIAVNK